MRNIYEDGVYSSRKFHSIRNIDTSRIDQKSRDFWELARQLPALTPYFLKGQVSLDPVIPDLMALVASFPSGELYYLAGAPSSRNVQQNEGAALLLSEIIEFPSGVENEDEFINKYKVWLESGKEVVAGIVVGEKAKSGEQVTLLYGDSHFTEDEIKYIVKSIAMPETFA